VISPSSESPRSSVPLGRLVDAALGEEEPGPRVGSQTQQERAERIQAVANLGWTLHEYADAYQELAA
jgi:hypothetical protein